MFWYKTPHPHSLRTQPFYKRVPRTGTSSMQRVLKTTPEYFTDDVKVVDLRKDTTVGPPLRVVVYTLNDEYKERVTDVMRALPASGICVRRKGKMYGKEITYPRDELLVSAVGPLEYRYSGGCLQAVPAESVGFEILFPIANSLAQEGEKEFKGALVNVYREPNDCVNLHRDKDVTDAEDTGVICVSVGDDRILRFKADPKVPGAENFQACTDIEVCNGQVYVMQGVEFQKYILHACLPPSKKRPFGTRISATFRRFLRDDTERKRTSTTTKASSVAGEVEDTERMGKRAKTEAPES